ncbi:GIY-YIG nuclease family protein [Draconibacterium mangrovi]|uniref:GIY-YIG nuclease family protein n=1 Tax=Draconibacterium mangrovi TaxID=2697469 RepID=UPI0037429362
MLDRHEVGSSNLPRPTKFPNMYYTYVLYSSKYHQIYIGYSADPEKRLLSHNDERNTGWTKRYQPWQIIHIEKFETKSEALKREKQLKSSRGRAFIRTLLPS